MFPVIYEIGPFTLRTYGLFLAAAFVLGTMLAVKRGEARGFERKDVFDLAFTIMVSSIIGSRLYYVFTHLGDYTDNPLRAFSIWEGGLSMFGGVVLALIASKVFVDRRGLSYARLGDVVAPALMLGTFVTRIGCFMNGCCFGTPTTGFFGVSFPAYCAAGSVFPDTDLHPTQLYASAATLAIFAVLMLVDRTKYREREGFLFGLMFVLYSVARSLVETLRYQDAGSYAWQNSLTVTWNQIIAAGLFLAGLYFIFRNR